jgi:hypothetical protein
MATYLHNHRMRWNFWVSRGCTIGRAASSQFAVGGGGLGGLPIMVVVGNPNHAITVWWCVSYSLPYVRPVANNLECIHRAMDLIIDINKHRCNQQRLVGSSLCFCSYGHHGRHGNPATGCLKQRAQ